MSEFEIASLDYQAATLSIREIGMWIAAAHVFVEVLQTAIIAWGIRAMIRAERDRTLQVEAQDRAAEQRHAENMRRIDAQIASLNALVEEQAEQRRASKALIENLEAQTAKLNAQTASLNALVERQAEQRRASAARTANLEALVKR